MKSYLYWGAFFGVTAVVLGALGAHALKKYIDFEQLASFETGVRYQMYHALLLLIIGFQAKSQNSKFNILLWMLVTGIILFSWSIFLLTTQSFLNIDFSFLGPVTPIGGMFLIFSWLLVILLIYKEILGNSENLNSRTN